MSHSCCSCYLLLLAQTIRPHRLTLMHIRKCLKISSAILTPQLDLGDGHLYLGDEGVLSHSSVHFLGTRLKEN